jgi:hypothetical protein
MGEGLAEGAGPAGAQASRVGLGTGVRPLGTGLATGAGALPLGTGTGVRPPGTVVGLGTGVGSSLGARLGHGAGDAVGRFVVLGTGVALADGTGDPLPAAAPAAARCC